MVSSFSLEQPLDMKCHRDNKVRPLTSRTGSPANRNSSEEPSSSTASRWFKYQPSDTLFSIFILFPDILWLWTLLCLTLCRLNSVLYSPQLLCSTGLSHIRLNRISILLWWLEAKQQDFISGWNEVETYADFNRNPGQNVVFRVFVWTPERGFFSVWSLWRT